MLGPEEAKEQLKQFENPKGYAEAAARVGSFWFSLKDIGLGLIEGAQLGYQDNEPEKHARWQAAKDAFEKLGDKDRLKLLETLFPALGQHVDATWQRMKAGPYQTGYLRRAFRAPHAPGVTATMRAEWLANLIKTVLPYRYSLDFLVVRTPHLGWWAEHCIGPLLATVLDSSGDDAAKTLATFHAILRGEHPVGRVARHLTTAMLSCSRPEAWEAIERLLLAAQRQEGLRQVVLETIDFAHPQAFLRMLRLIEREKLSRFAAVARAVAVWFGVMADSIDTKWLDSVVVELAENLESEQVRDRRLAGTDGQSVYIALWSLAYRDAVIAADAARAMMQRAEFEPRYAATRILIQLGITSAWPGLKLAMDDPDLRIAVQAATTLPSYYRYRETQPNVDPGLFEIVERLVARTPKKKQLGSAIWEWNRIEAEQAAIAEKLIALRTDQPWSRMSAFLPLMSATGRQTFVSALIADDKKTGASRDAREIGLKLLGDASSSVRNEAYQLLKKTVPTPPEAMEMEPLLARRASDLRTGVIRLLLNQPRTAAQASAERLRDAKDPMMQQAGLEMLSELEPKTPAKKPTQPTLSPVVAPVERKLPLFQKGAAPKILRALDDLIATQREVPVKFRQSSSSTFDDLLGNLRWLTYNPGAEMPLTETWRTWWANRPENLRDPDGLELPRALFLHNLVTKPNAPPWHLKAVSCLRTEVELKYPQLVRPILEWLLYREMPAGIVTCTLDAVETTLYGVLTHYNPDLTPRHQWDFQSWHNADFFAGGMRLLHQLRTHAASCWTVEEWRRYWSLLVWFNRGIPGKYPHLPALETTLEAHRLGIAYDADLYDQLLGAREYGGNHELSRLTRRKRDKLYEQYPLLDSVVATCKRRILDSELVRGDLPTPLSRPALALKSVTEAGLTLRILKALGKEKLVRGYIYDANSRSSVLSHLLRVSIPAEDDTIESFQQQAKELGIANSRLVDLCVYAPHWAPFAEQATGIAGLESVAFWLHAHTKDSLWEVDEQIRELWFAEVSERTPLSRQELLDGAVDVSWFQQMYASVGPGVWATVLESAKYASSAGGHKRAELFASALLGQVTPAEMIARIDEKRHQDCVRALGLMPLDSTKQAARKELLARYEALQKFLKESRQFGALRQASEKLAVEIGMANLARTAGYADPQRLSWAMEAEALGDLRQGAVEVTEGKVRVSLSINSEGLAQLTAYREDKPLKEIPASLKKHPAIAALRTRKTQLAQQTTRMRRSLEDSMVRGDEFTAAELVELCQHPLLRPMVELLVFVLPDGSLLDGTAIARNQSRARIAHPLDLLASGAWQQKQREYLAAEKRQPFKQLYRELYVLTEAERRQKEYSARYEGQQVNPQQAIGTVGKRGWVNVPEEGLRRTFHAEGISAWVTFLQGWFTPTDVDGLTVQHVLFTRRSDGKVVDLEQIEPRLLSEVMRDLDLMVSVAHRGGVDPEASASTTEMRAALVRETVHLLKLGNVRLTERHVLIDGTLGSYNVHLGSGLVHRQPGGSLCILPIHSQHRGRIFLPFADDDPKTAEIVSKVLLLANDRTIKDPTILEQLR